MSDKKKLFLITTVPMSFVFFKGQLLVLRERFDITLISSPEPGLYETAARNRVKSHGIKMAREISLFSDFVSLIRLSLYFLLRRPDVLHTNTPKASFLSLTAGWFCRIRTRIYYVHGLRYQGETGLKRKLLMMMEKISCFFATDIVAVSKGIKEELFRDGITHKNVHVIWNGSVNGIDLEYFNPDPVETHHTVNLNAVTLQNFVFGFVGRLVGDKGINELVGAFEKLNTEFSHIRLILVGGYEGDLDPLTEKTMKSIEGNANILQTGFVQDVRPYLKAMDLFVFPSYREGFGISLMEAAAMGIPAISSDIIGCNEVIEDEVTGFLIPARSEDALYQKMKFAVENPSIIEEMAKVCRSRVAEKYEQGELWRRTLHFYQEIKH